MDHDVEPESSTVVRSAVENSPSAVLLWRSRSRVFFSCSLSRDTFLFFGGGGAKLNVTLLNVALPALKRKPLADGEFVMSDRGEGGFAGAGATRLVSMAADRSTARSADVRS